VDGLAVTGPVYLRGLKVGMVEAIEYDMEKDNFEVEFKVKSDFRIPVNSVAEIYSADIMGSMAMRVVMGDSKVYAQGGDTLAGGYAPDMITMLTNEILPLKDQAQVLLENLNKTLENVNMTLDSSARENLQGSLASLNKTLRNAAGVSAALNKVAPEFEQIVENLQVLSKGLGESAGDIQGSLENVNKITSQLSQAELDKAIVSLRNLSEKLQDPDGSVGKLLSTDSLHNSVNDLIKDIDELVERITENPKKYIRVSVF
jgi:phospholipid/cholesterol/gamma-HCH transport system substrate-binding protein